MMYRGRAEGVRMGGMPGAARARGAPSVDALPSAIGAGTGPAAVAGGSCMQGAGAARARAATLAELVIGLTVVAMLFGAMMSAILIASRAAPGGAGQVDISGVPAALARLTDELAWATTITSAGDREITFVVTDRTGDGSADTIAYSWSGVEGAPLVRSIGGASENVVPAVQTLVFTYELQVWGPEGSNQGLVKGLLGAIPGLAKSNPGTRCTSRSVTLRLRVPGHEVDFSVTIPTLNQPEVTTP